MAVDQQIPAERRLGLVDQTAQRVMIGVIERIDPPPRLGKAQLPGIDLLAAGDHPGNRAEPHAHPGGTRVDEGRQRVREHRRIEFPGLAVDVEVGARETGRDQGRPEIGRGGKDRVDETVLGAPQGQGVETRAGEEIVAIRGPAMRRGDDKRDRPPRRLPQVEDAIIRRSSQTRTSHTASLVNRTRPVINTDGTNTDRTNTAASPVLYEAPIFRTASPRVKSGASIRSRAVSGHR